MEFGVVMMSEYSMGKDTCYTSSEPCSSVRRASCTALCPQSSHPPPVSTPDQGTAWGARGHVGCPLEGRQSPECRPQFGLVVPTGRQSA